MNIMNVIFINEESGGILSVTDTVTHAIDYLINNDWLSEDTELLMLIQKTGEWKEITVKEKLGENWEAILRNASIDEFNNYIEEVFFLSEEKVYVGES